MTTLSTPAPQLRYGSRALPAGSLPRDVPQWGAQSRPAQATEAERLSKGGIATVTEEARAEFDAFVRARLPHLMRFGRALTGSPDAGADLVQDALERTLLAWHRLDRHDDPEGYVRRIMVNRNISIWRKWGREHPTDVFFERGVEDQHHDDDLWRAISSLPPRQRAVIALRYYEDLSEAEIARTLGCSTGTVKSQASKAIAKLRALVPGEVST